MVGLSHRMGDVKVSSRNRDKSCGVSGTISSAIENNVYQTFQAKNVSRQF